MLKKCDIFIYQPVNESYGIYSSNNLIKYLNNNCIKIGIPFVYIDSFFPLIKKNLAHSIDGGNISDDNTILNKDVILNLKKTYTNKEIIELYYKNKIDFNYEIRFIENINRMREKEKECNVKITDFILENYKKQKLMYLHHHPNKKVLDHIAIQVFNLLNIKNNIIENKWNGKLSDEEYPYHQTSIEHFKFNFNSDANSIEYYLNLINNILNMN